MMMHHHTKFGYKRFSRQQTDRQTTVYSDSNILPKTNFITEGITKGQKVGGGGGREREREREHIAEWNNKSLQILK